MRGRETPVGKGQPLVGGVSDYLVKRAPNVKRRVVPCPDCRAAVGEPCLSATGKVLAKCHESRRRMAVRAQWEET